MPVNRIRRSIDRRLRRLRGDQSGSLMMAVIGIFALTMIIGSFVAVATVHALGSTSAARAGVQSQASADAGIAEALVAIESGTCAASGGVFESAEGTFPEYGATVYYRSAGEWVPGCPAGVTADLRIVSHGLAADEGINGLSRGDDAYVEAIYTTPVEETTIEASGPAIYAYSSAGFSGSGTLLSVDGSQPSVFIYQQPSGNQPITCDGGSKGVHDFVVQTGSLTITGGCVISGTAYVSGNVVVNGGVSVAGSVQADGNVDVLSGATVGGNVWAGGTTTITGGTSVKGYVKTSSYVMNGGTVDKDVWSAGGAKVEGTVKGGVYAGGAYTQGNGQVQGDVHTTGTVTHTGGSITGSVTGSAVSVTGWGGIGGSVYASAALVINAGNVGGNITGASYSSTQGKVAGSAWILGDATLQQWNAKISGNLTAKTSNAVKGNTVNGTITLIPSGPGASPYVSPGPKNTPATPSTPQVPGWHDYKYNKSDWVGFEERTISGNCTYATLKSAYIQLEGKKGIIDARGCTSLTIGGSDVIELTEDFVLLTKKLTLTGGGGFTATGDHRLWLITEDLVANDRPDCASGSSFTVDGGFTFSKRLDVLIYTPCPVTIASSTSFNGQLYVGQATISGGSSIGYVPVGLPGIDLDTVDDETVIDQPLARTLSSYRNLSEDEQ